jgi:hypothetical protein
MSKYLLILGKSVHVFAGDNSGCFVGICPNDNILRFRYIKADIDYYENFLGEYLGHINRMVINGEYEAEQLASWFQNKHGINSVIEKKEFGGNV